MRNRLIDALSPHLPAIRNTPYGRRIMGKIQDHGGRGLPPGTGPITGQDSLVAPNTQSQMYAHPAPTSTTFQGPANGQPGPMNGYGYNSTIVAPQPHRLSNPPLPTHLQATVNNNYLSMNGRMGTFF